MKYKTKLFVAFSSLVFISVFLALVIVYNETYHLLLGQIKSELLSIAVTSASTIDGQNVESITSRDQENSPNYRRLVEQLRSIRNSNRRPDVYIQNLYIIKPKPGSNHYIFVADSEENPEVVSHYGDLFATQPELYQNPTKPFVDKQFVQDIWGTWITAFAPILNDKGEVVATIGLDMSQSVIHSKLEKLYVIGIIALLGTLIISLLIAHWLAKLVTNSLLYLCTVVEELGKGNLKARAELQTNDEFGALATSINTMAIGLEEREKLKTSFARYVSSYIMEEILKPENQTQLLDGERRKVTIFFSDIRQFTTISENLPPEQVVHLLNEYFKKMIDVIFAFQGTLDKFLGDGLMVEFGAPLEDKLQEIHAVYAAINMQQEIYKLSKKWEAEGNPAINVGMGIHTGMAIVGNIGSEVRTEYTAIGDAVNVASRLERATKKLQRSIIISDDCYAAIKDTKDLSFEDMGLVELEGRKQPIRGYAVIFDHHKIYKFEEDVKPTNNK